MPLVRIVVYPWRLAEKEKGSAAGVMSINGFLAESAQRISGAMGRMASVNVANRRII
jgi:hypothetical protein